jgi:hypothetical protein
MQEKWKSPAKELPDKYRRMNLVTVYWLLLGGNWQLVFDNWCLVLDNWRLALGA